MSVNVTENFHWGVNASYVKRHILYDRWDIASVENQTMITTVLDFKS